MVKTGKYGFVLILMLTLLLGGCGYYFPHVYSGPARIIYMPNWQNRTNKLGLDAKIYQSLSRWFQKSEAIDLTKDKEKADLILAGEIVYIDLPSVSWDKNSSATNVKVKLAVRFVLKDLKNGQILWEEPKKMWSEDFNSKTPNATAEDEALKKIIEDISESIYLGTLNKIRKQNQQAGTAN